ncbi:Glutathione S-transferase T3 [Bienertia sinuspersici]
MLESHWRRMAADIMKWIGCYGEAKRNIRSGMIEEDVIRNSHVIYRHQHGKIFSHEHAWKTLEVYPKWQIRVQRYLPGKGKKFNAPSESDSSGKRARVDDEEEITAPTDGGDGNSVSGGIPRLDGVKRAKAARREGKKKASSGSDEVGLSLAEKLQLSAECREKHISVQMEKLELEREKEKRKEREMKSNTLMALLNKTTPLTEREEKLKDRLMSEVYGD